ncbi:titin [Musca domestica]|uniref:Titin n=1 Tax=Musca domestica TaxID=7370 RepID=A0A9J7IAT3_MUSDO|nr:titin [Musca domestica]XP_019894983.2 titin [Musca domestica]
MIKFKIRLLIAFVICIGSSAAVLSSAQLPVEARGGASEEDDDPVISTSYVLPNQIFNDGKPYYAAKDPISGQLDFNVKKPAGIETSANEVVDPNEKTVISSSSPNIHDFLNLPVKYSSSKFVYPLVSSSYANLKYQGSNKNYITNKKPTQVIQATSAPNYHTANYFTLPTTKLTPVAPTQPSTTSSSSTTTTTTTSTTSTTKKPTTTSTSTTSTTSTSTSTSTTSTSTSTTSTTKAPVPTQTSTLASSSAKYTTSSKRPTTTTTPAPKTSTTRKKFVPTKKYSTSTTGITSTTMHLSEQQQQQKFDGTKPTKPTTTAGLTTRHPTPSAAIFPTDATESKDWYPAPPSTSTTGQPVVFTEDPTSPPAFSPLPTSTRIPDLDPADVYHTLDQKNVENKFEQKPSMTLADIFNSLAEEESAVAAISNPSHQGLDAQGNLMEPLDPSKPSPFAMQQNSGRRPQAPPTKPTFGTTSNAPALNGQVISSNQENFNNEYVSYQVQQPNIMQYRPAPGAINNVVISPGQNSASFVLGSQQQVGANQFGSVEKEPLFSKEHQHPVQYGTVINEDISTLNRQPPPSPPTPYQEMPKPVPTSNFHQNGNYATDSIRPDIPRPPSGANGYQEPPPAAPSPYQQLPLIGSNVRNKISGQKPQPPQQPQQQQSVTLSGAGIGSVQSVDPQENADPNSVTLGSSQNTKELLVSTNIRFPANEEQSAEVPSLPVASGPPAGPQINGHAQPLSLQQIQNTNTVVFPKSEETVGGTVSDAAAGAAVQIQKHEVLTMSQHQQKLNFPTSNEPNTPATHMVPPPRFPPPRFPPPLPNSINEHDLQKPSRPHGGPQYPFNEYTRKPIPGITRPNPDRHLPNILPQFRPSSKVSTGHPQQTNFNQEPGNILVGGPQQPPPHLKRGPNVGNPQFSHRRQPLGQQSRYPLNRNIDYPSVGPPPPQLAPHEIANRRIYRVSPYGGQGMQYLERPGGGYPRRPHMPHGLRPAESLNVERHVMSPVLEKLPAFEEEDLVINDPPQPIAPSKESSLVNDAKLEPVVTLQMLQSQKKAVSLPNDDTGAGEIQVPSLDEAEEEINQAAESNNRNGLYVVYPMAGDKKSEVAAEDLKNKLPAVAHVEPPTGSEYQNTPFSVVRDEPQEPILKNKKPVSLHQQQKAAANKDAFPYPIEKPDPSYSELNKPSKVPGVLIAPKIINGAYGTGTIAPIAIAYTPTEPTPHIKKMQQEQHQYQMQQQQQYQQQMQQQQKHQEQQMYSNVNLATPVIKEIRQFDQAQDNGHDIDLRGQNYEKNFMAPFYPSVSLDSVTSTPSNGWNILKTTKEPLYSKNNIDRSDVNSANKDGQTEGEEEATENTTLKSFEMDKFQPELQGGFKPIYPPGYKLANEDEEQEQLEKHESNNMPLALASHMEMPLNLQQADASSTSSSTSSTTSTTTTAKPLLEDNKEVPNTTKAPPQTETTTKRIKSKFETSLAALLFGEDDTDAEMEAADGPREEPQARKEPTKAMMSGPRSIPRMGPRSLKI